MVNTVLVVGGAGYIGAHACKALASSGILPVTYDSLVTGHEISVKWGPLERGDLLDGERLAEVMARYRPQAVMHFAAFAYVGESVTDPAKYYRNNVVGTLSLLDVMRAAQVEQIVFSSTCAVYGIQDRMPITEDTPALPINPYGASKLMVERILSDYSVAYGMKAVALRYFNAAGCDPDGQIGEDHSPETHLIPLVLDAASGRRPAITVFGNDYPTPDGTCVRDYIHVSDLADAHVKALERLGGGECRPCYNLGTGEGISVQQLIDEAQRMTGLNIPVVNGARRAGDPAVLMADNSLAARELGWTPKQSSLDHILRTAWAWHQRRG